MLTAVVIGLALFAVLAAGVLALMEARPAAARVLVLAGVLAVAGAALAVVGSRVHASCLRDAARLSGGAPSFDPVTGLPYAGSSSAHDTKLASCDTSHALGLRDPF